MNYFLAELKKCQKKIFFENFRLKIMKNSLKFLSKPKERFFFVDFRFSVFGFLKMRLDLGLYFQKNDISEMSI